MEKRTIRDIAVTGEIWPFVDGWAKQWNYTMKKQAGSTRLYQRGTGFLTAPMMFQVSQEGQNVHIESWVRSQFFPRLMSLFILPAEMSIESGGFKGVVPRNMARKDVNDLLARLGQPLIP